jgi:hypothetical protein
MEARTREAAADAQITPRRAAFSSGGLTVAFVETAGGEKLRFFTAGDTCDCPLSQLPRFFDCLGFSGIGASLLMVYITEDQNTEVAVWHAQ